MRTTYLFLYLIAQGSSSLLPMPGPDILAPPEPLPVRPIPIPETSKARDCMTCRDQGKRYCQPITGDPLCCGPLYETYFPTDKLIYHNMNFTSFYFSVANANGNVDTKTFSTWLDSNKFRPGVVQIATEQFGAADVNKDRVVTIDEFAAYLFKLVDTDNNGRINLAEAQHAFNQVATYTTLKKSPTYGFGITFDTIDFMSQEYTLEQLKSAYTKKPNLQTFLKDALIIPFERKMIAWLSESAFHPYKLFTAADVNKDGRLALEEVFAVTAFPYHSTIENFYNKQQMRRMVGEPNYPFFYWNELMEALWREMDPLGFGKIKVQGFYNSVATLAGAYDLTDKGEAEVSKQFYLWSGQSQELSKTLWDKLTVTDQFKDFKAELFVSRDKLFTKLESIFPPCERLFNQKCSDDYYNPKRAISLLSCTVANLDPSRVCPRPLLSNGAKFSGYLNVQATPICSQKVESSLSQTFKWHLTGRGVNVLVGMYNTYGALDTLYDLPLSLDNTFTVQSKLTNAQELVFYIPSDWDTGKTHEFIVSYEESESVPEKQNLPTPSDGGPNTMAPPPIPQDPTGSGDDATGNKTPVEDAGDTMLILGSILLIVISTIMIAVYCMFFKGKTMKGNKKDKQLEKDFDNIVDPQQVQEEKTPKRKEVNGHAGKAAKSHHRANSSANPLVRNGPEETPYKQNGVGAHNMMESHSPGQGPIVNVQLEVTARDIDEPQQIEVVPQDQVQNAATAAQNLKFNLEHVDSNSRESGEISELSDGEAQGSKDFQVDRQVGIKNNLV